MDARTRAAIDRLAADDRSGASELLERAIQVLRGAASGDPAALPAIARAVGDAQPGMAPFWNAACAALGEADDPGALDRFERRWRRAGRALTRVAADLLVPAGTDSLHVTTCSFSGTVLAILRAVAPRTALRVACAEGRPALEGRRLAASLAQAGIAVEFYTDAGLAGPVWAGDPRSRVVLVGADAVAPGWFVNKTGTGLLAAAASVAGVPVYLAATRDKLVNELVAGLVRLAPREAAAVWDAPPPGVSVRNLVLEKVPIDLATAVITDAAVLTGPMIAEACRASSAGVSQRVVEALSGPA
jgi:translation initiation factor 2B subunit (eIF-2B alpha/beta/delta family)